MMTKYKKITAEAKKPIIINKQSHITMNNKTVWTIWHKSKKQQVNLQQNYHFNAKSITNYKSNYKLPL